MSSSPQFTKADIELYRKFQTSIFAFIEKMWGMTPQPLKQEYVDRVKNGEKVKAEFFEEFQKGKHLTWQQCQIIEAIERAIRKEGLNRISVKSGHGVGKSAMLAIVLLWYLFTHKNAQIPCTAPTSDQIYDILWKEVKIWLNLMPKWASDLFEWQSTYIRIKESPETWFARARTARKEAPEALAGIHGDYVMVLADEASGIPDEIFNTAEGSLTGPNTLVVMISNPTRLVGYFYESHHRDSKNWQTLHFNGEESPIVDTEYIERIIEKHGKESDEYRIRVLGEFPAADAVDEKGYTPLLSQNDIREASFTNFTPPLRMGIDVAGEGKDETIWVIRDRFKARIVQREKISNAMTILSKTLTLLQEYNIPSNQVYLDAFGVGGEVALEFVKHNVFINAVNVGDKPVWEDDHERFLNIRAMAYWRLKQWIREGGELIDSKDFASLLTIKYRAMLSGKIQMMPKIDMKKLGLSSPDEADALMLTFTGDNLIRQREEPVSSHFDPFSLF